MIDNLELKCLYNEEPVYNFYQNGDTLVKNRYFGRQNMYYR